MLPDAGSTVMPPHATRTTNRLTALNYVQFWLTYEVKTEATMAVSARAIDIVRLIATPQSSSQVHDLSEELQAIQASPEGWQVADDMLKHEDFHVRFYGALTMQIKLNKEA